MTAGSGRSQSTGLGLRKGTQRKRKCQVKKGSERGHFQRLCCGCLSEGWFPEDLRPGKTAWCLRTSTLLFEVLWGRFNVFHSFHRRSQGAVAKGGRVAQSHYLRALPLCLKVRPMKSTITQSVGGILGFYVPRRMCNVQSTVKPTPTLFHEGLPY